MINKLEQVIRAALPEEAVQDIKKNAQSVLDYNLKKMNLITRQQLEIDEKVIDRATEKINHLEKKLHDLESLVKKNIQ